MGLSLKYRPVIKAKPNNCCAEDLPQVLQVQVPEGVQGLPPGEEGRVRAGVGHGEVARAVQGRSRSGRRGQCSGPSSCPCWERRALDPGAGGGGTSST